MTGETLAAAAARIVERTRAEQGLPRHVDDAETLTRVALVLRRRCAPGARIPRSNPPR